MGLKRKPYYFDDRVCLECKKNSYTPASATQKYCKSCARKVIKIKSKLRERAKRKANAVPRKCIVSILPRESYSGKEEFRRAYSRAWMREFRKRKALGLGKPEHNHGKSFEESESFLLYSDLVEIKNSAMKILV